MLSLRRNHGSAITAGSAYVYCTIKTGNETVETIETTSLAMALVNDDTPTAQLDGRQRRPMSSYFVTRLYIIAC